MPSIIVILLVCIALELDAIRRRLRGRFPTELEMEERYERWWSKLTVEQRDYYQKNPGEWKEEEKRVKEACD